MNRHDIENNLKGMKFENLRIPAGHERQLKAALLEFASRKRPTFRGWMKETFKAMQTNFKPTSFVAGMMAMALVLGGLQFVNSSPALAQYNPFASKQAKAQATVKVAMGKAKQLTPEQREKIEAHMKADMQASLEEAYAAKDLTILTSAEMEQQQEKQMQTKEAGAAFSIAKVDPGAAAPNINVEKYLKYTDKEGRKVTLGISTEGVPVFKAMMFEISEGDKMRFEQGIKIQGSGAGDQVFKVEGGAQVGGEGTFSFPAFKAELKSELDLQAE